MRRASQTSLQIDPRDWSFGGSACDTDETAVAADGWIDRRKGKETRSWGVSHQADIRVMSGVYRSIKAYLSLSCHSFVQRQYPHIFACASYLSS